MSILTGKLAARRILNINSFRRTESYKMRIRNIAISIETAIPTESCFTMVLAENVLNSSESASSLYLADQIITVLYSSIATRAVSNIVLGKRKTDYLADFRFCQSREKCVFDYANIFRWNIQGFINFSRIKYHGKRIIITICKIPYCNRLRYSP